MRNSMASKLPVGLAQLALFLAFALALGGCPPVQFVADYDAATFEEILRVGKKVDRFYGDLLEKPETGRPYPDYANKYVEIETDIRSLWVRNQARPLNKESTRISEIILKQWVGHKAEHLQEDSYENGEAKLDRDRFSRLFAAAANAELAKNLKDDTGSGI